MIEAAPFDLDDESGVAELSYLVLFCHYLMEKMFQH